MLVQIKNLKNPNKAENPVKPEKCSGLGFFKKARFFWTLVWNFGIWLRWVPKWVRSAGARQMPFPLPDHSTEQAEKQAKNL